MPQILFYDVTAGKHRAHYEPPPSSSSRRNEEPPAIEQAKASRWVVSVDGQKKLKHAYSKSTMPKKEVLEQLARETGGTLRQVTALLRDPVC